MITKEKAVAKEAKPKSRPGDAGPALPPPPPKLVAAAEAEKDTADKELAAAAEKTEDISMSQDDMKMMFGDNPEATLGKIADGFSNGNLNEDDLDPEAMEKINKVLNPSIKKWIIMICCFI